MSGIAARVGDVFHPCEVLDPAARVRLASLVAVAPGQPPPVFPDELRTAALPHGRDERAALRLAVEAALRPAALAALGSHRFGEVVPALGGCPGDVAARPTPVRLQALLERHGTTTWALLAGRTLDEVFSWAGMGHKGLACLLGLAVEAALDGDPGAPAVDPNAGTDTWSTAAADLAALLAHDTGGALRSALEDCTEEDRPEEVRAAATRLLAPPGPRRHPALALLDRALAATGDDRDLATLFHCVLRLDHRPSLVEVATALGVGPERARQLRIRASERLAVAVEGKGVSELDQLGASLRSLGEVAPVEALDGVLAASALPALPDTRSLLALWLAGPYHPVPGHPGWVATDPGTLVAETRRLLREDGGVTTGELVAKELAALGVAEHHVDRWLDRQPVRPVEGLLVLTTGSVAEVAERVLFATGRAMSTDEVLGAAWRGSGAPSRTEVEAALRRDRRFVATGAACFELAEWGGSPAGATGGSPGRTAPEGAPPEGARCWLLVEVDRGVLAGAGAPVPFPLVEALGVRPGIRRTFVTRFGPVALVYDGVQPTRGSVRPVALAAGAGVGDVVALGFHAGEGDAVVAVVPVVPARDELDRSA